MLALKPGVQILPMSKSLREEMLRYVPRTDDPEIRARQRHVARVLLDMDPELREEVVRKAYEDGLKQGLEQSVAQGWLLGRVSRSVGCWRDGSCRCRRRTRRASKNAPISRRWIAGSTRRSLPRAPPKNCTDRRRRNRATGEVPCAPPSRWSLRQPAGSQTWRCCRSPRMSSICPRAERRSSAISCASTCGSGRVAESSRLSSRSQVRSRLTLSRASSSS